METPDLETVAEKLRRRAEHMGAIGGTVLIDLGDQGIMIDGQTTPLTVSCERQAADCRVRMKLPLLDDILEGRKKAFSAFLTGQIGINGDMSVAVKLQPLLQSNTDAV